MRNTVRISLGIAAVVGVTVFSSGPNLTGAPPTEASATAPGIDGVPDHRKAAKEIDRLVEKGLAGAGMKPSPRADDATFLRRVYLDVVGRIPDAAETRAFLTSKDSKKRAQLIDTLLDSPGYVSHAFNGFADLFRVKSRLGNRVSGEPYIHWLKSSIERNKPYDAMVREMVTATGAAHERDNGATGYLLRDRGMPLDNMANTLRIFAGTRLECAQCHDHPTEPWTQRQFFEMAAFTGGLAYANTTVAANNRSMRRQLQQIRKDYDQQVYRALRQQLQTLSAGLGGSGTGLVRLPSDYQYEDAKPGSLVTAKTAFGDTVTTEAKVPEPRRRGRGKARQSRRRGAVRAPQIGSRTDFAEWLTSERNPNFTVVIANRMWKKLLGRAVLEPFDDIQEGSRADNPELMGYLTTLMQQLDFDLKAFQRIILNTKTYQREAWGKDIAAGAPYHFPGPLLRRMSAEQMWDSLLTLVVPDVDAGLTALSPRAEAIYDNYEKLSAKTPQQLVAEVTNRDGDAMSPRDRARSRAQEQRRKLQPLLRKYNRATRRGDEVALEEVRAELRDMGIDPDTFFKQRRYGRDMVRASELQTPAPPGHFLRDFGQSDREQIEAAHRQASVPQVLNLLNGFVDEKILAKRNGLLVTAMRRSDDSEERIRAAYVTILNRQPGRNELRVWAKDMDAFGDAANADLIWTLVNCHEFRFIR